MLTRWMRRLRQSVSGKQVPRVQPEPHLEALASVHLGPGDVALDCGANVGDVTARLAATGATVHAYEPNPYAFDKLRQRFAGMPNVQCWNKGVLDRNSTVKLYLHEHAGEDQVYWSTGSSLLEYKGNVNPQTFVEVEVVDLTEVVAGFDRPVKVVKLDVEGVECAIIDKLLDTGLIDRIGLLLVETHDAKVPELAEPTRRIRERIAREGISNINLDWI